MRRYVFVLLGLLLTGCLPTGNAQRTVRTSAVRVDRVTPLEQSFQFGDKFLAVENQPGELIWLTGLKASCLTADGVNLSDSFLGYSTLELRWPEWHNDKFATSQSARFFGLGRGVPEFKLPSGYGLPMHSNEPLWYTSRIANPDPYFPAQKIGQELVLDFTRERGLKEPLKSVLVRPVEVRLAGNHVWEMGPGASSVRSEITDQLYLSDSCRRLVGATVWMLDSGRKVTLIDLTSGKNLVELNAIADGNGRILRIETYADETGILLDPEHRFALEAQFDYPGDRKFLATAYLNLYFEDLAFLKPSR